MPIPLRVHLGPLDDRHGGVLEHLLGLVPGRQRGGLVSAQDQEHPSPGTRRATPRAGGGRRALAIELGARDREAVVLGHRELHHLEGAPAPGSSSSCR